MPTNVFIEEQQEQQQDNKYAENFDETLLEKEGLGVEKKKPFLRADSGIGNLHFTGNHFFNKTEKSFSNLAAIRVNSVTEDLTNQQQFGLLCYKFA
jgi:hypothetical protein